MKVGVPVHVTSGWRSATHQVQRHTSRELLRRALAQYGSKAEALRQYEATASSQLAAQLLGHTDPKVTIKHDIRRNELVIR